MRIELARDLKQTVLHDLVRPFMEERRDDHLRNVIGPSDDTEYPAGTVAVGLAPTMRRGDFKLAIRCQERDLVESSIVRSIASRAAGEVDVAYVGPVSKFQLPSPSLREFVRPLQIGCSVGHRDVTAGTLGVFVRLIDGTVGILSNNHVLANENEALPGDAIVQPGPSDGGQLDTRIGAFDRSVTLDVYGTNLMDAAVGVIDNGIEYLARVLPDVGSLSGVGVLSYIEDEPVEKIGRTTGHTSGVVTAFELDDLAVNFRIGKLMFNDQLEIQGNDSAPFSSPGDSGSLIFDAARDGIGLLFAGSEEGGRSGQGVTYANPLYRIMDALNLELAE